MNYYFFAFFFIIMLLIFVLEQLHSQTQSIMKIIYKKKLNIKKFKYRLDIWKLHFESEIDCDKDEDTYESTEHEN